MQKIPVDFGRNPMSLWLVLIVNFILEIPRFPKNPARAMSDVTLIKAKGL